ncbi:histidine phosphatase family protein, partial [Klebsiella variicola]|uniref:histidine phosphatase family protein n=1 Tax=Klebsiella variicola TaxID=244366 RepID=UPI003F6CF838
MGSGTDLPVDRRKAKRLAHRIRAHARRHGLARVVVTSPRARAADVGRWLRRWGFRWQMDSGLAEMDFGAWDGRHWSE